MFKIGALGCDTFSLTGNRVQTGFRDLQLNREAWVASNFSQSRFPSKFALEHCFKAMLSSLASIRRYVAVA